MVNNAGASFRAKPEDISINGWNTVVQINLNGVFLGCKWAGKQMMAAETGGVIINISSIAGVYGSTMMSHYGASKAAVITLTRELGTAVGPAGHPRELHRPRAGRDRGLPGRAQASRSRRQEDVRRVAARVGMGRWGKVEEIA